MSARKTAGRYRAGAVGSCLLWATMYASAASLTVKVSDAGGAGVRNAVVYAEPAGGQTLPKLLRTAEIEQRNKTFMPLVTVVQTGAAISFPNNDKVRHQVYSFSPAKTFELKLYAGVPSTPVVFDRAGTVVLGCNIHDQMVAYVQIVNTPYYAKTDATGNARIDNLPDGKYTLKTWHYSMPPGTNAGAPELAVAQQGADTHVAVNLTTKIATE